MREYITELSRYIIPALMAVYTLCSFACLVEGTAWKQGAPRSTGIYTIQNIIMFFLQLLMFTDLALVSGDMEYVFFYVFVQVFLLAAVAMVPVIYEKANRLLLNNMCMLMGTGLCVISRISFNQAVRQYIIVLLSLAVSLFIPWILSQIHFLKKLTWLYGIAGIVMLGMVLLYSEVTYGAEISFTIGGLTFQPSEFVKIVFVFFLAAALWEDASIVRVGMTAVIAGAHVVILVMSKDLGSALIFFVGYVFVVFAATRNYLYLLAGAVGGSGAAWGALKLFGHVRDRVLTWRDPWSYIDKEGYSITQSLFAIGSGSWFGMGLLKGNPTAIPFVEKDLIFSSVCEELGVAFGICVILLSVACFLEMMRMSALIRDRFYQLVVYGIGIMYIFQIFLTIGGGIKLIPLTGVTLPFISYGGSSVMTTMIMFFLIQGIYIRLQQEGGRHNARKEKKRRPAAPGKKASHKKSRSARYSANRPEIIATCCFFGLLFAALIGYLSYFTATSEEEMINNSYNSRQEILLSRNYRGTIYSRDGDVLAETRLNEGVGEEDSQEETRIYPYGKLFAHAVGYSTKGRTGVEALANYYLINTSTSLANKAANDLAGIKNPGDSVYTTLDVELQQVADDQLNIYKGAIVVTEVATGKILAMVSHPGFDPNEIGAIWDSIVEDEDSSVLLNRVTQGQYPPGSTFKIVTALEYIRENPDTYDDYSYQCNGYFSSGTGRINCYHGTTHGQVGFESSFAKSCNSSFANIGVNLEQQSFEETLEELLFNRPLPVDFPYSESKANVVDRVSMNELMQTSIGQGRTQISPLHLNMITSAIANGGILMKPYAVDRVENDEGRIVKVFEPSAYGSLMTGEEAGILKGLMESVVEEGTGRKLSGLSYTAAGKTGSAEYNDDKEDSHAWFTGFAPVENPEICVTIIVEGAGSGGDYAVPIAKRIFDAYFNDGR